MHYYQFNLGDYARDTQHLDEMEDLAYRRMLDLYYLKEKPLPRNAEQIARLIRMRSHTESIANVLQEFFICEKDGYHNYGADKVLEKTYARSKAAREAAEKRWNKNNKLGDASALQPNSEGNAVGMQPITQDPLPKTHIKDIDQSKIARQELEESSFEYWWKSYPTKLAKKAAFKAWQKVIKKMDSEKVGELTNHIVQDVAFRLEALSSGDDRFIGFDRLHPTTYLNQERYNDDI